MQKARAVDQNAREEPSAQGRGKEGTHVLCPRRVAGDHHPARIASEGGDVSLDPRERCNLVKHAVVAGGARFARVRALSIERRVREPTESAQAVVDDNDHGGTMLPKVLAVEGRGPLRSGGV